MKRMISAILLASAIWTVCAEERVKYAASDGVNEVTARVRDDGVVIPESTTLAYTEPSPSERVTVYRLELHSDANGNEAAYVVGGDGEKRPVVLVEPAEYKMMAERLDAVWQSFHSTADGRRKLHGKLERTEIDDKARQKVEVYADGFRHTETLPVKRRPAEVKMTRLQAKIEEQKPRGMSDKQWEMRQAFKRHRTGVPKTVTVEHNAATGRDTVVEGK